MTSLARVKYTGSTPGADSNDYTLFSSYEMSTSPNLLDGVVARCRISLAHNQNGTFKLQRSSDGTTWTTINDETATATSNERSFYDVYVHSLIYWRVVWTNGGSAQTTWNVGITLTDDEAPAA